jgi:hypothetical protein
MPMNQREIIAGLNGHIQRLGGGFGDCCVGTAKETGLHPSSATTWPRGTTASFTAKPSQRKARRP